MSDKASKSLLDWFGRRREDFVLKGMREHGLVLIDAVNELQRSILAMSKGDADSALGAVNRLILSEKEADRIEDRLASKLSKGDLDSREREDLMHLVHKMDRIADWAMDGAIHVQLIAEADITIPNYIWDSLLSISSELVLEVKMLLRAVERLGADEAETLKCTQNIKSQERIVDEQNISLLRKILLADMDFRGTMMSKGLLEAIEKSADCCKDCADTIQILITARSE
ncbi:MAG TPA: DUF47 family protein [Candidatus Methanomethylophilaceae archaeon]|nr:uncharacterized protein [Candidatus Methanomethylophilaceae archaeon]HIJ00358.1 DUF47 family protein [Candidatus Methanomethylophilaceae archaeon]